MGCTTATAAAHVVAFAFAFLTHAAYCDAKTIPLLEMDISLQRCTLPTRFIVAGRTALGSSGTDEVPTIRRCHVKLEACT